MFQKVLMLDSIAGGSVCLKDRISELATESKKKDREYRGTA
jgi:hypothetical protein